MTNDEKIERKAFLKKQLTELQRKITLAKEILTRSRGLHKVIKTEYEIIDRKLFETSPGITILPEKKAPGSRTSTTKPKYDPLDYENMTPDERRRTLTRLLEIQKNQAAQT